jgi:hypothetical protein
MIALGAPKEVTILSAFLGRQKVEESVGRRGQKPKKELLLPR